MSSSSSRRLKKTWRFVTQPQVLSLTSAILILVFIIWLVLTYVPILWVETKYQTKRVLFEVFHVSSISQIFIPNFSGLNLQKRSDHQEYGIVIPKIYIDEPVVFNVDPNDKNAYTAALKKGIAHASGTAFPDNAGIGYYFAHSSNAEFRQQYNAIFYLLGKLKVGDEIYIWHENQDYKYKVSSTEVTNPNDVEFLGQTYDKETIVLQTCWPPGTTNQRLLVFAERDLSE